MEMISQGFSGGPWYYIGHDRSGFIRAGDAWTRTNVPFPTDGQYHLFVLVVDASGDQSFLYVDQQLRATTDEAITTTSEGSHTRFGRQFDVPSVRKEWFHRMLRGVLVFDTALDASEVEELILIFSDGFE